MRKDKHNQIKIVFLRKQQMKQLTTNYITYLTQSQIIYYQFCQKLNQSIIKLDQNIQNLINTQNKSNLVKSYQKHINQTFTQFSQTTTRLFNQLKTIFDYQKLQQKLHQVYQQFIKMQKENYNSLTQINKIAKQRQKNCQIFNKDIQSLSKSLNCFFIYDGNSCEQELSTLQEQYQKCFNLQENVKTELQVYQCKNIPLTQIIKQMEEKYILYYQKNISIIIDGSKIIIKNKQQAQKNISDQQPQLQVKSQLQQSKKQRILNKQKLKSQNYQQQFINQLEQFQQFLDKKLQSSILQIENQLIQQKCNKLFKKQTKIMQDIIAQRILLIKQFQYQNQLVKQIDKQFNKIEKSMLLKGYPNKIYFYNKLNQIYGKNVNQLVQISLMMINSPLQVFKKGIVEFNKNIFQLNQVIKDQELNMKKFYNFCQNLIHEIKSQKIEFLKKSNSYELNTSISLKKFIQLKQYFYNVIEIRNNLRSKFDDTINNIIKVHSQIVNSDQLHAGYQILNTINVEKQIIHNIRQNQIYDVLFGSNLNSMKKFKSLIKYNQYQNLKTILHFKNQNAKNKDIYSQQSRSCCIRTRYKIHSNEKFQTSIIKQQNKLIKGILSLNNKLMYFQKFQGFFDSKLQLFIPLKQIRQIQQKQRKIENYTQFLSILTKFGQIKIASHSTSQIIKSLKIITKLKQISPSNFIRQSSYDQSNKQQNVIITPQTSFLSKLDAKNTIHQIEYNDIQQVLGKIAQQIKKQYFFSQKLKFVQMHKRKQYDRINYTYNGQYITFSVKQLRKIQKIKANILQIHYNWKLILPNNSLLNSIKYRQIIRIIYEQGNIKLNFTQNHKKDNYKFVQKLFIQEIQKMNKKIMSFIANSTLKMVQASFTTQDLQIQLSQQDEPHQIDDPFQIQLSSRMRSSVSKKSKLIMYDDKFDNNQKIKPFKHKYHQSLNSFSK